MTPPITPTFSLDAIIQEIRRIIQHSDPDQIKDMTTHVQGIFPTESAKVTLRSGSNDEDKRASLTFCADHIASHTTVQPLEEVLLNLLMKTQLDDVTQLGRVLEHLKQFDGKAFEWGASKPEYINGVGHVCYFFIHSK
jgi:hypothetical protein